MQNEQLAAAIRARGQTVRECARGSAVSWRCWYSAIGGMRVRPATAAMIALHLGRPVGVLFPEAVEGEPCAAARRG